MCMRGTRPWDRMFVGTGALPADLLRAVLHACRFDTLCALLATHRTLADLVLATLRAESWRQCPENERALQLAAWSIGEVTEGCMGAFDGDMRRVQLMAIPSWVRALGTTVSKSGLPKQQPAPTPAVCRTRCHPSSMDGPPSARRTYGE